MRCRQRGVALITALLVVALATTAATAMLSDQYLAIRRTQNVLADGQAWQYALAGETVALDLLAQDRDENDTDGADDVWSGALPPVNEGAATIRIAVTDLQGRINLNALAGEEATRVERVDGILTRLVAASAPEAATSFAPALADWADEDLQPRFPDGAEDDFYTRRTPAYRSANAPLAGVSELRLLRGVEPAAVDALRDVVVALPPEARGVNLNTAPAAVLEALHPAIGKADAERLISARSDEAFASVSEILREVPAFAQPELPQEWLRVASEYFLVTSTVELGRVRTTVYSVVHRPGDGPLRVLYRGTTMP